jgi:hypothetical protein
MHADPKNENTVLDISQYFKWERQMMCVQGWGQRYANILQNVLDMCGKRLHDQKEF